MRSFRTPPRFLLSAGLCCAQLAKSVAKRSYHEVGSPFVVDDGSRGCREGADDVLRVSGVEMRVNGSSNKYGALRCELLYSVVNSGSSFRHKRRMPGREQVAATKERRAERSCLLYF